jgi:ribosomal protein S27E
MKFYLYECNKCGYIEISPSINPECKDCGNLLTKIDEGTPRFKQLEQKIRKRIF